jgi:hypothetical protein
MDAGGRFVRVIGPCDSSRRRGNVPAAVRFHQEKRINLVEAEPPRFAALAPSHRAAAAAR